MAGGRGKCSAPHRPVVVAVRAAQIAAWPEAELPLDEKVSFFKVTRHAFGRTALLLSGGGGLGTFHMVRRLRSARPRQWDPQRSCRCAHTRPLSARATRCGRRACARRCLSARCCPGCWPAAASAPSVRWDVARRRPGPREHAPPATTATTALPLGVSSAPRRCVRTAALPGAAAAQLGSTRAALA